MFLKMERPVLVEISARHVHVSKEALAVLFGEGEGKPAYAVKSASRLKPENEEVAVIVGRVVFNVDSDTGIGYHFAKPFHFFLAKFGETKSTAFVIRQNEYRIRTELFGIR